MGDKEQQKKFENFLWKVIGSILGSLAVGLLLGYIIAFVAMENESQFLTWSFVCFMVCAVSCLVFFTSKTTSKSMKGKDDLENQRFLKPIELDEKFTWCYFHELKSTNKKIEGWPINCVYKNGKMKIHFSPNYHMIVIGSTGVGKTVTFVEPTIQILSELKTKPSMFITDTKGELYAHHSKKLVDCGYDLKLLNLSEPYNSLHWNPLENVYKDFQRSKKLEEEILVHINDDLSKYHFVKVGEVHKEKWYEFMGKAFGNLEMALSEVEVERTKMSDDCFDDLNDIASALCPITPGKDAQWDQGAKDYVLAVLVAMLEDSANPSLGMTMERFIFYNMYKIAMNKENDMEYVVNYFKGRSPLSKTRQLISHITDSKAKTTRDSYMSLVATRLGMFSDNGINFLTSKNEIDFMSFDEKPTAFFIKIPDERKTRYTLASVCISQAYKQLVRKARRNEYEKGYASLSRPVYYIMDEFAQLPPVNELEKLITVARSRRIYFAMIIQSYAQLDAVYGKDVAVVVRGNCNGEVYFGSPDNDTREQFSKKLGNYTIKVDSKSTSKGADGKDNSSISTQFQSRPLVYPRDLVNMKNCEAYIDIFPNYPLHAHIDTWYQAKDVIYKFGKVDTPFIPGKRLNEDLVYYEIRDRNKKILGYE